MGLTKSIMTRYPVTDGLIAGTTSQIGHQEHLIPEESILTKNDLVGL